MVAPSKLPIPTVSPVCPAPRQCKSCIQAELEMLKVFPRSFHRADKVNILGKASVFYFASFANLLCSGVWHTA
jgi:hypothetical protein